MGRSHHGGVSVRHALGFRKPGGKAADPRGGDESEPAKPEAEEDAERPAVEPA